MTEKIILQTESLSKSFGKFEALRDASLTVREGKAHAIIGPNGAGKTTLVNVITGLFKPTSGTVRLADEDITTASIHDIARRGLVRTSQITSLFSGLTVRDNVEVAVVAREKYRTEGRAEQRRPASSADLIDLVGLSPVADRRVDSLSHGDQRLLELAVALAIEPSVLLLDEPTAGMSPLETGRFIDLVNGSLKLKYTVVLIEHDMAVVMGTADQICVLHQGSIIADGAPEEIMSDRFVREAYLGSA